MPFMQHPWGDVTSSSILIGVILSQLSNDACILCFDWRHNSCLGSWSLPDLAKKQESDPVWYRHAYMYKSYLELLRRYVLSPKNTSKNSEVREHHRSRQNTCKKNTHAQHMNKNTQPSLFIHPRWCLQWCHCHLPPQLHPPPLWDVIFLPRCDSW